MPFTAEKAIRHARPILTKRDSGTTYFAQDGLSWRIMSKGDGVRRKASSLFTFPPSPFMHPLLPRARALPTRWIPHAAARQQWLVSFLLAASWIGQLLVAAHSVLFESVSDVGAMKKK